MSDRYAEPRKMVTWVLVADGAHARILVSDGPGEPLHRTGGGEYDANLHHRTREVGTDRPGRVYESANSARHAMENRVDWHRAEKGRFAHDLAERLGHAAAEGAYDRLVLVAPPRMLGDLRADLDERTRRMVVGELAADLTHHDEAAVTERVRPLMAA